jgi:WD40 repeat protein
LVSFKFVYVVLHDDMRIHTNVIAAQILASASYDDTIKLYLDDPSDDWFCAATLTGHTSTVWSLAWEPRLGRYLASSSDDQTIRIWRRFPGKEDVRFECVAVIEGHERSVYSISWCQNPSKPASAQDGYEDLGWLASTGGDGNVLIWQITVGLWAIETGRISLIFSYRRHPRWISHQKLNTSCLRDMMLLMGFTI